MYADSTIVAILLHLTPTQSDGIGLPTLPLSLIHFVLAYNVIFNQQENKFQSVEIDLAMVIQRLNDKASLKTISTPRVARDSAGLNCSLEPEHQFAKDRATLTKSCSEKGVELRLVDLDSRM